MDANVKRKRKSGIGGSDTPKIVGVSKWGTALDVYLIKLGLKESTAGEAAYWGTIHEPTILREYSRRNGYTVLGRVEDSIPALWVNGDWPIIGDDVKPYVHPDTLELLGVTKHFDIPHMLGNFDGFVIGEDGIPVKGIDAKTSSAFKSGDWGGEGSDDLPEEYVIQMQHYMEITASLGLEIDWDIPVLIGGNTYKQYEVRRDAEFGRAIATIVDDFWNKHILTETPPPATMDALGGKALEALYPADDGETVEIPEGDPLEQKALELADVKLQLKELEDRKAALETYFKDKLGSAKKLIGAQGWSVSWSRTKDKAALDKTALVKHIEATDPDLVKQFMITKPGYRTFRTYFSKLEKATEQV